MRYPKMILGKVLSTLLTTNQFGVGRIAYSALAQGTDSNRYVTTCVLIYSASPEACLCLDLKVMSRQKFARSNRSAAKVISVDIPAVTSQPDSRANWLRLVAFDLYARFRVDHGSYSTAVYIARALYSETLTESYTKIFECDLCVVPAESGRPSITK
jgi:hypothetical protein